LIYLDAGLTEDADHIPAIGNNFLQFFNQPVTTVSLSETALNETRILHDQDNIESPSSLQVNDSSSVTVSVVSVSSPMPSPSPVLEPIAIKIS
jgi:hypothetical protein